MSSDPTDDAGPARRLGRLRAAAGAAGLAALGSLAGCSSAPDGPVATEPPPDGGTAPPPTVTPGDTGPAATEPAPTTAPPPTTPLVTLSTAECRDRVQALEAELATVQDQIDGLRASLPVLRRKRSKLEAVAELYDPPPDQVIADAKAVGTAAREAVVFLEAGGGTATAWYVDDHHLVTNAHNVYDFAAGDTRDATVWTLAGDQHPATTVGFVESLNPDVALLRTDATAPATLTPGTTPSGGGTEPLVQVGHPGGIGNWMITLGHLRGVGDYQAPDGSTYAELETDVPGRQGVSGSPVLNFDAEVVGLTYAGSPVEDKQPDERPIVADPVVYDRPIAALSYGFHVDIDTVMARYEGWT